MSSSQPGPTGSSAPRASSPALPRLSTRRRLIAAFSVVLAAFVGVFGFQIAELREMEETLAQMKDHEAQVRMALQLEDAVRDRYAHQTRWVLGERSRLVDAESARARAVDLVERLTERVDELDGMLWMQQIRDGNAELDRLFREEVSPAVLSGNPSAMLSHDRGYRLVSEIESNIDRVSARLQEVTSTFRERLVRVEQTTIQWTTRLLVAMAIFVAGAVRYLSRSVAEPLARLSEGAARLARGDLDARIDIQTRDEFGVLAAEFNSMTVALEQHQERLIASEKLAGIGRLAAGVAHELNNPLQVMLGYLSLNRDLKDPRLAVQLAAVEEEVLRCKEIVNGLLELSRPATRPARVDLRAMCEDVAGRLQCCAPPSGLRLRLEGAAFAFGDGARLRQVVFNLMKNAVEAAGPAGNVEVRIGERERAVEVAVSDSGPGIARDERTRLFEPFFTTKPAGIGLGLAVSRAIALAHGGDIDVGNGDPAGAVFTLRLPRAVEGSA